METSTPLRTPPEIEFEIRRARKSSRQVVRTSRVLAAELLQQKVEDLEAEEQISAFAAIIEHYMHHYAERYAAGYQEQADKASNEASSLRSQLSDLRRAILVDFLHKGEVEKLVTAALKDFQGTEYKEI